MRPRTVLLLSDGGARAAFRSRRAVLEQSYPGRFQAPAQLLPATVQVPFCRPAAAAFMSRRHTKSTIRKYTLLPLMLRLAPLVAPSVLSQCCTEARLMLDCDLVFSEPCRRAAAAAAPIHLLVHI